MNGKLMISVNAKPRQGRYMVAQCVSAGSWMPDDAQAPVGATQSGPAGSAAPMGLGKKIKCAHTQGLRLGLTYSAATAAWLLIIFVGFNLVFGFSTVLAAETKPIDLLRRTSTRILVLDYPLRYSAPDLKSDAKQTNWRVGSSIPWTDIKIGDDRASRVLSGIETPTTAPLNIWYKIQYQGKAGWLPDACLAVPPADDAATTIGEERVDRWAGLAPDTKPADLVPVGPGYEKDRQYLLRKEAAAALAEMIDAARADRVKLMVVSGYRPWQTQQDLYRRRVKLSGPGQQTVAKPGHSEHQLGTAVDLTDGNEDTLLEPSFGDTPAGKWLRDNAPKYGFAVSFTLQNRPQTGFAPEPWHYRYWGKNLAKTRHASALGLN